MTAVNYLSDLSCPPDARLGEHIDIRASRVRKKSEIVSYRNKAFGLLLSAAVAALILISIVPATDVSADDTKVWITYDPGKDVEVEVKYRERVTKDTMVTISDNSEMYSRSGYHIIGWNTEPSLDVKINFRSSYYITADTTIYAVWEGNHYTAHYYDNDDKEHVENQTLTFGQSNKTLGAVFLKTGYEMTGWYDVADTYGLGEEISMEYIGDREYYAIWTPNTYNLYYDYMGADGASLESGKVCTFDSSYGTLPVPTKSGYTFNGWFTAESGGTQVTSDMVFKTTSDTTIYAQWTAIKIDPLYYVVNCNASPSEGGTVTGTGSYEEDTTVTVVATPNSGYNFDGWSNGVNINSNTFVVTGNTTLTAYFTKIPDPPAVYYTVKCTISPSEGGTVTGTGSYEEGTTVTLVATPNEGYEFSGWNDDPSDSYTFTVTKDTDLTASFSLIPVVTPDPPEVIEPEEPVKILNAISKLISEAEGDIDAGLKPFDIPNPGDTIIDNSVMMPEIVDGKRIKLHFQDDEGKDKYIWDMDCNTEYNDRFADSVFDLKVSVSFDAKDVFGEKSDEIMSEMNKKWHSRTILFVDPAMEGSVPYSAVLTECVEGFDGKTFNIVAYDESSEEVLDLGKECVATEGEISFDVYNGMTYMLVLEDEPAQASAGDQITIPAVICVLVVLTALISVTVYRKAIR